MTLVRCSKCDKPFDVPADIALKLPTSLAVCACGALIAGNRTAILARLVETGNIREIDMTPYATGEGRAEPEYDRDTGVLEVREVAPRNVRIVARGTDEAIDTVFSIADQPLWIGRRGCHIELEDAELSIRHCSIENRRGTLYVRDADSYSGSFLDGQPISEMALSDGTHLLRVGDALICIEPSDRPGLPVEAIPLETSDVLEVTPVRMKRLLGRRARNAAARSKMPSLRCIEGPLIGEVVGVPQQGLVIGREGDVRINDEYLSRRHLQLTRETDGSLRLRDLGSRNGTFLNTLPVRNSRVVAGDEIRAGGSRFLVEEQ